MKYAEDTTATFKKKLKFDVFNELVSDYDTDGDFKLSLEEF